jgi:hypothetical protein
MYDGVGLGPDDSIYANLTTAMPRWRSSFCRASSGHGVKRGDAFAFYASGIRVEGPHPFCSSGGNLGTGRLRTAMYTDSIEQLRGTAGACQVRVRAETALAAFTTPSSGGWIMFGKNPN